MAEQEYVLEIACAALRARVALNDCTVLRTWEPRERVARLRLNPWCLLGDNDLEVFLAPFETASDEEPRFDIDLHKLPPLQPPSAHSLLLGFTWTTDDAVLAACDAKAKRVYRHRFRIQERYGDWCWLDAAPYRDEERERILAVVERFHRALQDKDSAALHGMLKLRTMEICQALALPVEETELAQHEFFESYFAADDWQLTPVDAATLQLMPNAAGRLVQVTDEVGATPLIGYGGGRPFAFDLTLSRIDGDWLIVR